MPIRMLGSRHLIGAWGSLFDPVIPITVFIQINHRDWSECAETSNERARVGQYLFRGIDEPESPRTRVRLPTGKATIPIDE
jgi:hypothetical protein